jgi:HSP20 family molecular chaperone IbpA
MDTRTRWDPFQDLRSAQDEMAQMSPMLAHALGLHGQQGSGRATATAWAPALDISERKDAYLVTVELPGRGRGPGGHPGGWPVDHPGRTVLRP